MAAELERSEEHFRALIENASDLILIVEKNAVIRYASPSVERMLGYAREQVSGRQIAEFIHPDDVALLQMQWQCILPQGVPRGSTLSVAAHSPQGVPSGVEPG